MCVLPSDRQPRTQAQLITNKSICRLPTTHRWLSRPKKKRKAKRAPMMKKKTGSMMTRTNITTPYQTPRTSHNLLRPPKLHPKPKETPKDQLLARVSFKLQRQLKLSARRTNFSSRKLCKRPKPGSSSSNSKRLRLRKSA